jgi:hypothetical protein
MAILSNPRHERFFQLVASGMKPTAACISLGYSPKGAPQSANKLLKRTDVRERVDEILQAAAVSTVAEIAFDQQRVLNRLDILKMGSVRLTAPAAHKAGATGLRLGQQGLRNAAAWTSL